MPPFANLKMVLEAAKLVDTDSFCYSANLDIGLVVSEVSFTTSTCRSISKLLSYLFACNLTKFIHIITAFN